MNKTSVHRLHLANAKTNLAEICRQVIEQRQRIEFECSESDDVCVLISRAELQTLERALAIFASADKAVRLHENVTALCRLAAEETEVVPETIAIGEDATIEPTFGVVRS